MTRHIRNSMNEITLSGHPSPVAAELELESRRMERNVEIRHDHELYVVTTDGGVTSYGFDYVLERVERLMLAFGEPDGHPVLTRGSREAWDTMVNLQDRAKRHYDETGEKCIADLTPQLIGNEGWRVEVTDEEGDKPRRFIVGKSTGWIPVHLEISRRTAHGGGPARPKYHSVTRIERVR